MGPLICLCILEFPFELQHQLLLVYGMDFDHRDDDVGFRGRKYQLVRGNFTVRVKSIFPLDAAIDQ